MTVPGLNLLGIALGAIGGQKVGYRAWQSRAPDAKGILKDVFAERVEIVGSLQPMDGVRVQMLGLDIQKNYATLYATQPAEPVSRDRGADLFDYAGKVYTASDKVDWTAQDGWNGVVLVESGKVEP